MESCYNVKYFDQDKKEEKTIPLEKMVGILLNLEMNKNFHIEALKAQAIVIRTNILKSSNPIVIEGFKNIWEEPDEDIERIIKAVEDTEGLVIKYNGKIIDAKYHSVCGGSTENAENVIDNKVIYLRRVLCDYCEDSPYWENEKSFSIEEIEKLLKIKFPEINIDSNSEITGFMEEVERDESGRVISIEVGNEKFSGKALAELLDLDSTRFAILPTGIKFISRGKGHGMGLCQYGANEMAKKGYIFEDILKYYYTGIEIEKVELPSIKRPLYGKVIVIDPGHGGDDKGYVGDFLGIFEKDIVLDISLKMKPKLEELGATVHLTRDKDMKVLLIERSEQANNINPDFFISIHMDYFPNSKMKGVEMFHFRNDYESQKLGSHILKNIKKKYIPTRGIKEGNFYAFRGISSSSLLLELGYLSNMDEEIKFQDHNYIEKLADGIIDGILEYFKINF